MKCHLTAWFLAEPAKGSLTLHTRFFSHPCNVRQSWVALETDQYFERVVRNGGSVNSDACYSKASAWTTVSRRIPRPVSASVREWAVVPVGARCSLFPRGSDQFHSGVRSPEFYYNRKFFPIFHFSVSKKLFSSLKTFVPGP